MRFGAACLVSACLLLYPPSKNQGSLQEGFGSWKEGTLPHQPQRAFRKAHDEQYVARLPFKKSVQCLMAPNLWLMAPTLMIGGGFGAKKSVARVPKARERCAGLEQPGAGHGLRAPGGGHPDAGEAPQADQGARSPGRLASPNPPPPPDLGFLGGFFGDWWLGVAAIWWVPGWLAGGKGVFP